ncbi:MAG: hypothetical protein LBH98_06250 [Chitinispirillales bacterium]|nr:hypothetical protein [Chitinispirillales bacterium]
MEDFDVPATANQIGKHSIEKGYYSGETGREKSFSWPFILACLNGDARVKRIKNERKNERGIYAYYLASKEAKIKFPGEEITGNETDDGNVTSKKETPYLEEDLHKLFVSYLKNEGVYAKTINHKQAKHVEPNQNWTHPDIVGVKFLNLTLAASARNFLNAVNKMDTFNIYSYELKREIQSDRELKEYYFQAVANSTWANYGYLVAFDINDNLLDELKRLNKLLGIGFIELSANPFESKIVCLAQYKNLDFDTISKLCKQNEKDFVPFIDNVKNIVSADEKYHDSTLRNFEYEICDKYFKANDYENIEKYCLEKHIPIDDTEEGVRI